MAVKHRKVKTKKEWPLVVYFWIVGLGFMSYVVTRIALDGYPHPIHWASGLVGAIAGYFIGWIWYRWRGDII
jgi:hypothetical protein